MSLNNLLAAILLVLASGSFAEANMITCPLRDGLVNLSVIGLFDGPPSELVELVPEDGGWTLGYKAVSPAGFFIVCKYYKSSADQNPKEIAFHVPPGVKACMLQDDHTVLCQ